MTSKDNMLSSILSPSVIERIEALSVDPATKRPVTHAARLGYYIAAVQAHYCAGDDLRCLSRAAAAGMPTAGDVIDYLYSCGLSRYRVRYARPDTVPL